MEQGKSVAQMSWGEWLHFISELLDYQLFALQGHGISLGKFLTGLAMLAFGYLISRRAANEVDRRVFQRFGVDDSLRYTLRRFVFYFFVVLITLFILHLLNVPVTIFTVLGGALAVGIGFGSQQMVNNFISGILLMVERPVRVRDFVEIDGISGQIENIGIRATVLRMANNAMTIIPNTLFIQNKLTNWTRSGIIACAVRLVIAHETNTSDLSDICLTAVREVDGVLRKPAPRLNFTDISDRGLVFDLNYSIDAELFPHRGMIESGIRFRLHELLKKHAIEIIATTQVIGVVAKLAEMPASSSRN